MHRDLGGVHAGGLHRQDVLTHLIQTKRAGAARKNKAVACPLPVTPELAAQRDRARVARTARKDRKSVEIKEKDKCGVRSKVTPQ